MPSPILIIPEKMFPETPLPDLLLAPLIHRIIEPAWKISLDQSPPDGIIWIPGRHPPYAVDMIRKNHKCFHDEGVSFHDLVKSRLEANDIIRQRKNFNSLVRHDGKEIRTSRLIKTTIFAHVFLGWWIRFAWSTLQSLQSIGFFVPRIAIILSSCFSYFPINASQTTSPEVPFLSVRWSIAEDWQRTWRLKNPRWS